MSLKKLLGEELYNQVIEKTGDNKIAIVSDGNWFPKDKFDEKNNELKDLQGQLTELQTTLKSKETELGSIEELKKEIASHKLDKLKTNIAIQANIPLELANRLSGENEEELKLDAEKIAAFVNKKTPLPLKTTEPSVDDKDAGLKKMLENMNKQ